MELPRPSMVEEAHLNSLLASPASASAFDSDSDAPSAFSATLPPAAAEVANAHLPLSARTAVSSSDQLLALSAGVTDGGSLSARGRSSRGSAGDIRANPPNNGSKSARGTLRSRRSGSRARVPSASPLHPELWARWQDDKRRILLGKEALKLAEHIQEQEDTERPEDIDFTKAGKLIADKLKRRLLTDTEDEKSHLDIVQDLRLVETVWIKASERGNGLSEEQFVQFLSSMLGMKGGTDKEKLRILFQKMDANSDKTLTWGEYLDYLLREIAHQWRFSMARGSFHLRETDSLPYDTHTVVRQILVVPADPNAQAPGKYVLSCDDDTVQVWNSDTMTFQGLIAMDAAQQRKKAREHVGSEEFDVPVKQSTRVPARGPLPPQSPRSPVGVHSPPSASIAARQTPRGSRHSRASRSSPLSPLPVLSLEEALAMLAEASAYPAKNRPSSAGVPDTSQKRHSGRPTSSTLWSQMAYDTGRRSSLHAPQEPVEPEEHSTTQSVEIIKRATANARQRQKVDVDSHRKPMLHARTQSDKTLRRKSAFAHPAPPAGSPKGTRGRMLARRSVFPLKGDGTLAARRKGPRYHSMGRHYNVNGKISGLDFKKLKMMLRGDPESSTQGRSQVHSSGDGKVSTPEVSSGSRPPHALAEQRYQSTSQTAPAAAPNVPVTGALADAHGQKPGSLGTAQRSSQQLPEHAGHPRKRAHDLRISTGPAGAGASSAITVGDVGHIRPHTPVGRPSTARSAAGGRGPLRKRKPSDPPLVMSVARALAKNLKASGRLPTHMLNPQTVSRRYRKPNSVPHVCICYWEKQRQVLVASTERIISFYGYLYNAYFLVDAFYCINTPRCLCTGKDPTSKKDILVVGDTKGSITVYDLHTKQKIVTWNAHGNEIVRSVELIAGVGLISGGMDGSLAIWDQHSNGQWRTKDTKAEKIERLLGHTRGVHSFVYSNDHKCLVSAGYDRQVLIWERFQSKGAEKLPTRHQGIFAVLVNEKRNQLITVSEDKKIKVFDIRNFTLLQTLVDSTTHSPSDRISAAAFDVDNQRLVTAGSRIRLWPVTTAPGNMSRKGRAAHDNVAVIEIMYSPIFNTLISVTVDGNVHLWDLYTGQNTFGFTTSHTKTVSAACLDSRGKRLITASHALDVKMWNFNNAELLKDYPPLRNAVVTGGPSKKNVNKALLLSIGRAMGGAARASKTVQRKSLHAVVPSLVPLKTPRGVPTKRSNLRSVVAAPAGPGKGKSARARVPAGSALGPRPGSQVARLESDVSLRLNSNAEISALLFLPNNLRSVVGVGLGPDVVRWPDPSAPKNARLMVQQEARSTVTCVAARGEDVVTGGADGELIWWYKESGRPRRRLFVPSKARKKSMSAGHELFQTPATIARSLKARTGVTRVKFASVNDLTVLFVGTDDGSLHIYNASTFSLIHSVYHMLREAITAIAVDNQLALDLEKDDDSSTARGSPQCTQRITVDRVKSSASKQTPGADMWQASRLLLCDYRTAVLLDISNLSSKNTRDVLVLREAWSPHTNANITSAISVDDIEAFATSSDTGEIALWTLRGQYVAHFGQKGLWPVKSRHHKNISSMRKSVMDAYIDSMDLGDTTEEDLASQLENELEDAAEAERDSAKSFLDTHRLYNPKTLDITSADPFWTTFLADETQQKKKDVDDEDEREIIDKYSTLVAELDQYDVRRKKRQASKRISQKRKTETGRAVRQSLLYRGSRRSNRQSFRNVGRSVASSVTSTATRGHSLTGQRSSLAHKRSSPLPLHDRTKRPNTPTRF